jgi:diguanylate cyclase (GGDEF)-like protein
VSNLRAIGRAQDHALSEFRSSDDGALLMRLAQTECLLELAKLSAARIDLNSYAGTVVGIVTQFVPSRFCAIEIEVPDVPPIAARFGKPIAMAELHEHLLTIDECAVGRLTVVPEVVQLTPVAFIATISEQISMSLGSLIEAERLRRQAAIAETIHLVEVLSDLPTSDDLARLVEALASLPNALGASIEVTHIALNGSVALASGAPPLEPLRTVEVPGGSFSVGIRWATAAQPRDNESLDEIVGMLSVALGKADERQRLRDEAETDPLTGIGNRRRAMRALASAIERAEKIDGDLGVVYLDLDHFKRVNDTCGHDVGDRVLISFCQHIATMVRAYDSVNRIGGEEFLIICPGLSEDAGESLALRIVDATAVACADSLPPGWNQTASAGIASFPAAGREPDALLLSADRALYAAKHGGRNQVRRASSADAAVRTA